AVSTARGLRPDEHQSSREPQRPPSLAPSLERRSMPPETRQRDRGAEIGAAPLSISTLTPHIRRPSRFSSPPADAANRSIAAVEPRPFAHQARPAGGTP